ncbi:Ig-like domain-containing protein [Rhodobacteraceae bacterium D3-12]|nr:Ig-like domain-containing protein [Rhodobacteraceae bacterium D3-12]
MKPIGFAVRDGAGAVIRSEISADGSVTPISAGAGQEISLNLRQSDVQGYQRLGTNLQITLNDGRVVILEDFYGAGDSARLFISADGYLNEVSLAEGADGAVFATYGPAEQWGKWSPSDQLIFLDGTEVAHVAPTDDNVSMLGAGLLGGLGGGAGLLGAGAAVAGAGLLGGAGGGSASQARIEPAIDQDGVQSMGGDDLAEDDKVIVITGKAEPGSEVVVTIGEEEVSTTTGDDGTWGVEFTGDDFPEDGTYDVVAVVTEDDGTETTLNGPEIVIDTTGPEITFEDGTKSVNDLTNAEDHSDGVEIAGSGEAGASIDVTINDVTHSTTVAEDGSWEVVFLPSEVPGGSYETEVTVVSTDSFGNSTTVTDVVVIDTEAGVTIDANQAGGDDIINATEQAAGVTLTGTAEAGSSVVVTMNGYSHTVTATSSGTWSADFASSEIPTGEQDVSVTAVATDVNGNSVTTSSTLAVDTINSVTFNDTGIETDGTVNAVERSDGLTLTGTTQAGSVVTVEMNGVSHTATVDANGNWSVDFAAGEIPQGETDATVNVSSVDAAGNVATTSGTVNIDTLVNNLELTGTPGGADSIVNAVEAAGGATLTGTVEPGSTVIVQMGSVSHQASVDANGNWTANFAASEIPQGNHDLAVTATATDAAGNTSSVSGNVVVDTVVENLGFNSDTVEGDNIVNDAERADGVPVAGTVEPGSTVLVTMGSVTQTATVDAMGNWSTNFPASAIPQGEYDTTIEVNVTDAAGNTDSISQSVRVDTLVNTLTNSAGAVEGDNIVNATEAQDGFTLTGQVEPGSTVMVDFGGQSIAATVDAAGMWSAAIPASAIASGEYTGTATINATDAAGNTDSITRDIEIDTTLPGSPDVASYTRDHTGIRGITTEISDDTVSISHVHNDGSITDVAATGVDIPVLGETTYAFNPTIPDGSHLVVSAEDGAGNMSSTYLVLDESSTSVVNMANPSLGDLQIESIDLQFAEESQLTITEEQLVALSDNTDSVVVHGGSDDTVTITGATRTGETQNVNGEAHEVYTLGDTGTLIIDDDITVVI